jgi:hypothetical protein
MVQNDANSGVKDTIPLQEDHLPGTIPLATDEALTLEKLKHAGRPARHGQA